MSSSLEAAEKLKLLLIQMRDTCRQSQAIEHEAIIEREQRSMAKDARLDDLFRDLKYVQDGIEDIKENQLTTGVETGKLHKVSSEAVEEILRVAEDNRKTQLAHLVALMEECSERRKEQNIQYLRARNLAGKSNSTRY